MADNVCVAYIDITKDYSYDHDVLYCVIFT